MLKRILDQLGFLIIIYGLSLGFVFLLGMLDSNNGYVIFLISPLSFFISIYLYKAIRELKLDCKQTMIVYDRMLREDDEQLENYKILDQSHQEINGKLNVIIGEKDEKIFALEDEISDFDKYKNKAMENPEFKEAYDELEDIPFTHKLPYIGQQVTVKYAGEYKNTHITKILDEKVLKYRCAYCGSRKYLEEDMKIIEDAPHNGI